MGLFTKKIKPLIIGVCGRSCSGKSTIIKELEEKPTMLPRIITPIITKNHHWV